MFILLLYLYSLSYTNHNLFHLNLDFHNLRTNNFLCFFRASNHNLKQHLWDERENVRSTMYNIGSIMYVIVGNISTLVSSRLPKRNICLKSIEILHTFHIFELLNLYGMYSFIF
jgi:hypothetical protein